MPAELESRGFFGEAPEIGAHVLSGGYFHFWRRLLASDYFADAEQSVQPV